MVSEKETSVSWAASWSAVRASENEEEAMDSSEYDGRISVEVMAEDPASRSKLRVRERHARIGQVVWIEHEDGLREAFSVISLLEPRPTREE